MKSILELMQGRSTGLKGLTVSKVALLTFLGMSTIGLQAQSASQQLPQDQLDYAQAQLITKTATGWQVKTLDHTYTMKEDPRELVANAMPRAYSELREDNKLVALDSVSWLPLNRINKIQSSRNTECIAYFTPLGIITGEKESKKMALQGIALINQPKSNGHAL